MGSTFPRSNIAPWAEDDEENESNKSKSENNRKTFEFSVDSKSERFKDSKVLDTARSTLQSKKKPEPANTRVRTLVKHRNYCQLITSNLLYSSAL